ncbi:OmpA family protein [Mucilaginibacter limnophilus]|uniref:OmpA family protein n=1 Tax=Mucilaginibacter limnophilus TaxID=1932778 RepID=A0A3S2WVU4_9SPHI|nr:OmpA family protein [Mucilaginibacter limnophilus]RVT97272.1 OmpA family protein [Mucilaginibacter limnophilus]
MKRYILPVVVLVCFSTQTSNAQFLNKLKKKAEAAVNKAIDEQTVPPKKQPKQAEQPAPANTPSAEQKTTEAAAQSTPLQSYEKYDFIPGQNLIYTDSFKGESIGELPAGWNSNGNGAVTKLNNFEGNWMRLDQNGVYLPGKALASTDNFTLEFDVIFDLKSNGYGFPEFFFGMIAAGKKPVADNSFLNDQVGSRSFKIEVSNGTDRSNIRIGSYNGYSSYFRSPVKSNDDIPKKFGKIVHVSLQAQKERLRLWIEGDKIIDAPKALPAGTDIFNQLFFQLGSSNYTNQQIGIYVSNIKVAQGAADMRNKLVNEGRFSTSGILFDVNAATIKPESNGILTELAAVLKDNPSININIIGHTDSDGNAAANQKLSLARAESVKNTLVNAGIDAARLKVAGKGASQPLASNTTETGKAQNRRVEFIKL